jgi:diguanylate cyclase (GGDEF)-like protein
VVGTRRAGAVDALGVMDGETMGSRLPARVGLLALLYGSGALCCLLSASWPMDPETPVALDWTLAAVGAAVAGLLLGLRDRLPVAGQHAALGAFSLLVAVYAAQSPTAAAVVGLGPALISVGLYAAHFLPSRAARAHALVAVAAAALGAAAAAPDGYALPWSIALGATLVITEAAARLSAQLRTDAFTDPLTGVANRRAWEAEASRSLARATRTGEPLTVALIDLDDFKAVNDREGHSAGDRLLRQVAAHWRSRLRSSDLLGRQGGDEFALCLPGTDGAAAQEVLARLDGTLPIGWSVGTATARAGDSLADLLQRADAQLYRGKRRRRGTDGD